MEQGVLAPKKIEVKEIFINALWAFIAWVSGSVLLMVFVFITSSLEILDLESSFKADAGSTGNVFFAFFLAFITFFISQIVAFVTYIFLTYTSPESYSRSWVVYGQIAFLWMLVFVCMTPIYIMTWVSDYSTLIFVFTGRLVVLFLTLSVLIELLNDYRYILVWLFSSLVATLMSVIVAILIYWVFPDSEWLAQLILLLILLPVINFLIVLFKWVCEFLYAKYYELSGNDPLGDIFHRLELAAAEDLKRESEENTI